MLIGIIFILIGLGLITSSRFNIIETLLQRNKIYFTSNEDKNITKKLTIGILLFFIGLFIVFLSQ